jgi:hypothetical protein
MTKFRMQEAAGNIFHSPDASARVERQRVAEVWLGRGWGWGTGFLLGVNAPAVGLIVTVKCTTQSA